MHILEQWKLNDIEQKADRANSRLYEIDSLNSHVADLERTIRELRSECDGLRDGFQRQENQINQLMEFMVDQQVKGEKS